MQKRITRSSKFKQTEQGIKSQQFDQLTKKFSKYALKRPPSPSQSSQEKLEPMDIQQDDFSQHSEPQKIKNSRPKQKNRKSQPNNSKSKDKRVRKSKAESKLQNDQIWHRNEQDNVHQSKHANKQIDQSKHLDKMKKSAPKKKKTTKKQQNQGTRIIQQRKIKYLFRNICDPEGNITLQSLGKSLLKHKIQFKLKDLKEMLKIVKPNQQSQIDQLSQNSQSVGDISEESIEKWIKDMTINFEEFDKFYDKINKK